MAHIQFKLCMYIVQAGFKVLHVPIKHLHPQILLKIINKIDIFLLAFLPKLVYNNIK